MSDNEERYYVMPWGELTIWGHTIDKEIDEKYPEDRPIIEAARDNGYEYGRWYSIACPDGEVGSNDIQGLWRVPKQEFENARKNDWKVTLEWA